MIQSGFKHASLDLDLMAKVLTDYEPGTRRKLEKALRNIGAHNYEIAREMLADLEIASTAVKDVGVIHDIVTHHLKTEKYVEIRLNSHRLIDFDAVENVDNVDDFDSIGDLIDAPILLPAKVAPAIKSPPVAIEKIFWILLPPKHRQHILGDAEEAFNETLRKYGSRNWAIVDYAKEAMFGSVCLIASIFERAVGIFRRR